METRIFLLHNYLNCDSRKSILREISQSYPSYREFVYSVNSAFTATIKPAGSNKAKNWLRFMARKVWYSGPHHDHKLAESRNGSTNGPKNVRDCPKDSHVHPRQQYWTGFYLAGRLLLVKFPSPFMLALMLDFRVKNHSATPLIEMSGGEVMLGSKESRSLKNISTEPKPNDIEPHSVPQQIVQTGASRETQKPINTSSSCARRWIQKLCST